MRRGGLIVLALLVSALLVSPAAGAVLIHPGATGAGKVARFTVKGSNGYTLGVYAPLGASTPVTLTVESRKGAAQYVATGTATPKKVEASFGALGQISMRFHPSGQVFHTNEQGDEQCPYHAAGRAGTFVGTFRFAGEHGYTKAAVHKVDGGVGAPTAPFSEHEELGFNCFQQQDIAEPVLAPTPVPIAEELPPGGLYLNAAAATPGGTVHLAAEPFTIKPPPKPKPPAATIVVALVQEEVEGVRIGRIVFGGGKSAQVLPDSGSLATATLTPGAPFVGSATYTAGATGTGTLTGDLAVAFPGLGSVPLTGPTFAAELLRPRS